MGTFGQVTKKSDPSTGPCGPRRYVANRSSLRASDLPVGPVEQRSHTGLGTHGNGAGILTPGCRSGPGLCRPTTAPAANPSVLLSSSASSAAHEVSKPVRRKRTGRPRIPKPYEKRSSVQKSHVEWDHVNNQAFVAHVIQLAPTVRKRNSR
ncbi:unnamed protein product [Merluccius merluccius]